MTPISAMRFGWLAGLLFLAACYDAPRDNPFDPALTPPVELQVALDDTAGTATLTWTRYEGKQPFREYQVLRNIVDRKSVDTLAHLPQVKQTSFVDSSLAPNTAYVYRVAVLNAGGFDMPSEERSIPEFRVGAISLLAVESDPQEGALVLRWNRYVGPDFHAYQIRRRLGETLQEVILAEQTNVQDTTFVDRTAQAEVGYVYTVKVQAAGQELVSSSLERRLKLPPVEIAQADFNSVEASATLAWTHYQGPRFKAYRVLRRTEELAAQVIKETVEIADTSLVDTGLLGNTEYFYQVVVVTERGEEVKSEEKGDAIHRLVDTWPLPGTGGLFIRLYREGGRIAALVKGNSIQFGVFDSQGQLQEEVSTGPYITANSVGRPAATTLGPEEGRFISISGEDFDGSYLYSGILPLDSDGQLTWQESELFTDVFPEPLSGAEGKVLGEIALPRGIIDNVTVSTDGRQLFAEDFSTFPEGEGTQGLYQGWEFSERYYVVNNQMIGNAHRADESWQDFRMEADGYFSASGGNIFITAFLVGIQIGGNTFSRFALWLDREHQQATLDWAFSPPAELGLESKADTFKVPFKIVPVLPYRLSLEVVKGKVRASVKSPVFWDIAGEKGIPHTTSLAALENTLALTVANYPYSVTLEGEATPLSPFNSWVSEIRVWEGPQGRGNLMGICLPQENLLRLGRVQAGGANQWSRFLLQFVGPRLGQEVDFLFNPTSFDVGPDGRIYVLDAGHSRIVVFDRTRTYITRWGRKGDGPGEFNFGEGERRSSDGSLNFEGSVAVDDEGYIYVADVFNRRIQKFAP